MRQAFSVVVLAGALLVTSIATRAADLPFVNWENHPVHALDLSPDGDLLAVAHTADQRVQLFDVSTGTALAVGHVVVGVDPVSVRFRSGTELWVVNHISDSISVIDLPSRRVVRTLATADEPFDVVFASGKAFVSCSQANVVQVFAPDAPNAEPVSIPILGEDPRALAVSADGRHVYVAVFESGNASTILGGGLVDNIVAVPNVVSDARGPYGGQNPPPNAGTGFEPPMHAFATPPRVGLIVRKNAGNRWLDDNARDWSEFVSGSMASASGRPVGWDLPDRDLAIIDTTTLQVDYARGLMNIVMALAVQPGSGKISVIGTDALNEVRFEPNVNGRFVRTRLAQVDAAGAMPSSTVLDLNPHLDYRQPRIAESARNQSLGDPRAIVWRADGQRAYVAGMGSNNVIVLDASGDRVGSPIGVGEGPVGLALDEPRGRLYAWNHFEASLSVLDVAQPAEITRVSAFNPLPVAIRAGRPFLYDTHRTSGLGQAACASCHIDARMDRLAWDLGDPSQPPAAFDQNCITTLQVTPCQDFHSMKGPMTTQTLQDIIGHEPFHWRGDRAGLEAFNPAFEGLLGDDEQLTDAQMQSFEDFLATITFPPNPFRNPDNSLPAALPLAGHYTSGRFATAGQPLGAGDATRGLELFTRGLLDPPFQCANCHTLPTGMAANGPLFTGFVTFPVGGIVMPEGAHGENHLGVVSVDGSTNVSIKVAQLRNQYEKVGFETSRTDNTAGFGFLHDGSVDSLSRFMSARGFTVASDRDIADLVALVLAFSGSEFSLPNPLLGGATPPSRDTHAAVGQQITFAGGAMPARLGELQGLAQLDVVDLIVRSGDTGLAYDASTQTFESNDGSAPISPSALLERATPQAPQTWTVVPKGLGRRLGVDRDGDGIGDAAELIQGSNPADAESRSLRPATGPWYNPQRDGHGIDLEFVGDALVLTWYTYLEDGSPVWYLASAPFSDPWVGELRRFAWNPQTASATGTVVGEARLDFSTARELRFDWRLGARSGFEPMQTLFDGGAIPLPDYSGAWSDPGEPGWGVGVFSEGGVRGATLYFYDQDNQPRWVLGVGSNAPDAQLEMNSFRGFCPHCAPVATRTEAGGSIVLQFEGTRDAMLVTDAFAANQASARWQRGPVAIRPVTDPPLRHQRN